MKDDMKLKVLVRLSHSRDQILELQQRPSVKLRQLLVGDSVNGGVEIIEVAQEEAAGVSDLAIRVDQMRQDRRRDAQVLAIILRGDPETKDFCAVLLDDLLGRDNIAGRF